VRLPVHSEVGNDDTKLSSITLRNPVLSGLVIWGVEDELLSLRVPILWMSAATNETVVGRESQVR